VARLIEIKFKTNVKIAASPGIAPRARVPETAQSQQFRRSAGGGGDGFIHTKSKFVRGQGND
jgi:hypothetical protein